MISLSTILNSYPYLAKGLNNPAMVATRRNPDVQALYERLVVAGKPKMCALGAAMRKLVHICYGVYKSQKPYQPQASLR